MNSNNLIIIPFAFIETYRGGVNISNIDRKHIYLKNCCVSCITAKKNGGSNNDVALVTNIDIPNEYKKILEQAGVRTYRYEFDLFTFDKDYMWSLAFYKLCALAHVLNDTDYTNYSYLDSDVYVQSDFTPIWEECEADRIMLYDICHGLQVKDYRIILDEMNHFRNRSSLGITHYGGEFFAANRNMTREFIEQCRQIYSDMVAKKFDTTKGDEFILSLAADNLRNNIRNAGAYIFRYWTGMFRLVATNYKFNPVAILHVPNEKETGMIVMYDKYIKNGVLPKRSKVWDLLHLTKPSIRTRFYIYKIRMNKLIKRRIK